MRLVVTEFITLDGVIEHPGGSEGIKNGGWSFPYWNEAMKYVFSTTLTKVECNNSTIIKNNIAAEVSRLKGKSGKDILVAGSANLIQTLIRHSLVNEYWLLIYPVVLGAGKWLFRYDIYTKLRLIKTKPLPAGAVLLRFEPEK